MPQGVTFLAYHACRATAFGLLGVLAWGAGAPTLAALALAVGGAGAWWGLRARPAVEPPLSTVVIVLLGAGLAVEGVFPLGALAVVVLAVVGFEFSEFSRRYPEAVEVDSAVTRAHLVQVGLIGALAMGLGALASSLRLELGFWPVLALAVLTATCLLQLYRRSPR